MSLAWLPARRPFAPGHLLERAPALSHPRLYDELQFNCKDMCSPFKYNPDVISIDGKSDEDDLYEITKYCDNEYLVRDIPRYFYEVC